MIRKIYTLAAVLFSALMVTSAHAEDGDAILILDASGSMWGQIDEKAKIAIAKEVLGDLLKDLPADRRLGLMAYGHRREGDCGDIEMLAPVGADRSAIGAAVSKISPKGKTPMADSIKKAAESLNYIENKATVILVSDGIETCEPDPCGVAAALEKAGADFTVHVVGFDVAEENAKAQLQCLAENTGGVFVSASDAAELGEALEATVVAAPEAAPSEATIYLRATELEGGLLIENGLSWTVTPAGGGAPVIAEENAGVVETAIAPGAYDIAVVRSSDGLKGEAKGVVIKPNAAKTVTIALVFPVEATVRVEPEGSAMAGTNVKIHFTGPARRGDYVAIAEKGADAGSWRVYSYASQNNPAELRLPVEPGTYEIRYVLGRPIRILASADYEATPATATLSAPDTALAGEEVNIEFTGPPPGASDWITIAKPDDPDTKYNSYAYTRNGSPAKIRMPLEPGEYEIRFVQGGKSVLARHAITVTEGAASVSAKERAVAGETVSVEFSGPPAGSGDWITVTAPDAPENKYNDYAYARNGSPAEVRMPLEPGEYEIRYVQGGKKVIARQTIIVEAAVASLSAKATAVAGETLEIAFEGPPAGPGDYIVVAETDAPAKTYLNYAYVKSGSPATLRMPLDAGAYELRYLQGGNKIIARQTVTLTAATATMSAPAAAPAKSLVSVEFTGPPPGASDYIVVSSLDQPDLKYITYGYVKGGSPAKVRMPNEPGEYELRYIQGGKKLLARRPIRATAAE